MIAPCHGHRQAWSPYLPIRTCPDEDTDKDIDEPVRPVVEALAKDFKWQNLYNSYVHLKKSEKKIRIFFLDIFLDFFLDFFGYFFGYFFTFLLHKKIWIFFWFFFRFFLLDKNIQKKSRFFYVVKMEKISKKYPKKKSRKKSKKKIQKKNLDFFSDFFRWT